MVYVPNLWINHFLRDDLYLITGLGDLKEEGKIITLTTKNSIYKICVNKNKREMKK